MDVTRSSITEVQEVSGLAGLASTASTMEALIRMFPNDASPQVLACSSRLPAYFGELVGESVHWDFFLAFFALATALSPTLRFSRRWRTSS